MDKCLENHKLPNSFNEEITQTTLGILQTLTVKNLPTNKASGPAASPENLPKH